MMCACADSWKLRCLACLLVACCAACSDSVETANLDALVSEGRVGGGGGAGIGVSPDASGARDATSADAGVDVTDGSGAGDVVDVVEPDPVVDEARQQQILQSARRSAESCTAACPEAAVCVLSIDEELCVTSCANIPAVMDRATDDSVEALRCARSIETLWVCIASDFNCEDYVYARDGRFTRCAVEAGDVDDFCVDFDLSARSLLEL